MKCSGCERRSWARTASIHGTILNHFKPGDVDCCVYSKPPLLFAPSKVPEPSNFKYPTKTPCIGPSTQRGWLPLPHPCSSTLTSYNRHLLRSMPVAAPASSSAHLTNTSSLLTSPASPFICPICLRPSFSFYCCWLFWPAACFTRCYYGIINIFALASWTTSELCYRDLSLSLLFSKLVSLPWALGYRSFMVLTPGETETNEHHGENRLLCIFGWEHLGRGSRSADRKLVQPVLYTGGASDDFILTAS